MGHLDCDCTNFMIVVFDEYGEMMDSQEHDTYGAASDAFSRTHGPTVEFYRQDCRLTLIGRTIKNGSR